MKYFNIANAFSHTLKHACMWSFREYPVWNYLAACSDVPVVELEIESLGHLSPSPSSFKKQTCRKLITEFILITSSVTSLYLETKRLGLVNTYMYLYYFR